MTYGHSTSLSAEDAMVERALASACGTSGGDQAWRLLDPDRRLALIEQALKPANDFIDNFPVAL